MTQTSDYLAVPAAPNGAGVLVLHAWWGLNDFFKSVCDRLAGEGFMVLAPDMFNGQVAVTIEEAEVLGGNADQEAEAIQAHVRTSLAALRAQPTVNRPAIGIVGFSFGAFYAVWLAGEEGEAVNAVTLFYGTGWGDYSSLRAPIQGHFAKDDPYEPSDNVEAFDDALTAAGVTHDFFTYPGTGHWFFETDRTAYQPEAAELAWTRTIDFLRTQLL